MKKKSYRGISRLALQSSCPVIYDRLWTHPFLFDNKTFSGSDTIFATAELLPPSPSGDRPAIHEQHSSSQVGAAVEKQQIKSDVWKNIIHLGDLHKGNKTAPSCQREHTGNSLYFISSSHYERKIQIEEEGAW